MPLELITSPSLEPVTLDEAKAHLKVDTTADDALISSLITAARARAEWHTGRAFVTQSWILWLDAWPQMGAVEIPLPPLQSVGTITSYARDAAASVLDASNYQVDAKSEPGRVALKLAVAPPVANLRPLNAIAIAFTAGYGGAESDVPGPVKAAILEIVTELYTNRGDGGAEPSPMIAAMLAPYRVLKI
jgi:uncharacterized phiE125 gp8 family phage protein